MNTLISPRRIVVLLAILMLTALSGCCLVSPKQPVTHTITITYNATATPQWSYSISPEQSDAANARVRRGDSVIWRSDGGNWTVEFNGESPLVNQKGGDRLSKVYADSGSSAGGVIKDDVKIGDVFKYDVSVLVSGSTTPVRQDPRIIIEK